LFTWRYIEKGSLYIMSEIKEIWKDVKGYESKYCINEKGFVKSKINNIIMKQTINNNGYYCVSLSDGKRRKTYDIHLLLSINFLNHTPSNTSKLVCDHIDNNKLNNKLSNLQLITHRKNLSKDRKNKTSKYTGVSKHKSCDMWVSQIHINGRKKYLGLFRSEYEAYLEYKKELNKLNK